MTEAPPTSTEEPAPTDERVLQRSGDGRMITGVCAGLGRYTGMDPVLFRVGFGVLILGSGIGIMLYIAAFLLMKDTEGRPGYVEQWTRRIFDTETVLALLAAVFAFGLIINVASGGIGMGTIVVGTLLAIALLAAHARGVDLIALAKSLPERIIGRRGMTPAQDSAFPWPGTRSTPSSPHGMPPQGPYGGGPYPGPHAQPPHTPYAQGPYGQAPYGQTPYGQAPYGQAPHGQAPQAPYEQAPYEQAQFAQPPHGSAAPGTTGTTGSGPAGPAGTLRSETTAGETAATDRAGVTMPLTPPAPPVSPTLEAPLAPPAPPAPSAPSAPAGTSGEARSFTAPDDRVSAASAESAEPGFRRLSDLAREARLSTHDYASGEPFAPRGPYARYGGTPYPPVEDPYFHDAEQPKARKPARRPKSFIGGLTICLALIVGGIMVAVQQSTGSVSMPVIGGAVLVTIGTGLLIATWFGRGAGLVAAGVIVSLALVAGSTLNGIPKNVGSYAWHPSDLSQTRSEYTVGIGDGKLDLSDVMLAPGSRTRFDASVSIGQITVIVPPTARVEVHGYARVGEVKIDHKVEDGMDVRFDKVLDPEVPGTGDAPTIELHVQAGIGDVAVRRGA
ncbi:PspC domain-containing protein [Microtetraspora sp. NBRC 16547]|uniref:PspC domain-containing protein n=1 Tax=Microtetraspora sp. NBRC 16547 TaxID=3030993 RepID=UPI0025560959|nr:PspC domain-containing protein [Microtetraspora sp. NBRC 16547]